MSGRKAANPKDLLANPVRTRVTAAVFKRLVKLSEESNCQSVGEVARKILSQEKIHCFYRDISMSAPMEELVLIRKELKAIGININQITRSFNQDKQETRRAFYVLKVADLYKNVELKVEELLGTISQLSEKWLQKS